MNDTLSMSYNACMIGVFDCNDMWYCDLLYSVVLYSGTDTLKHGIVLRTT